MANIYKYNPPAMKGIADSIAKTRKEFEASKNAVESIVTTLNNDWDDEVNRKYSRNYLKHGKPKADALDKLIQQYNALLYMSANRFGSAIDSGNLYLTGF